MPVMVVTHGTVAIVPIAVVPVVAELVGDFFGAELRRRPAFWLFPSGLRHLRGEAPRFPFGGAVFILIPFDPFIDLMLG
jgi:hypothetical protein